MRNGVKKLRSFFVKKENFLAFPPFSCYNVKNENYIFVKIFTELL
jgi:hypothetical protein